MSDPTERPKPPPIRGEQLATLRAIAAMPVGLHLVAYPSAISLLAEMALVE